MLKPTVFPERIDPTCGNGRARVYDECGDQKALFRAAFEQATADGKVLLVSYGAEWCIWCHVFDHYIAGKFDAFTYELPNETRSMRERRTETMAREAANLNRYVSETFVIANIEYEYASGADEVLEETGADAYFEDWAPFIFTVADDGKIAAVFDHNRVEAPTIPFVDNFRGYKRVEMLDHLKEMAEATRRVASTGAPRP